MYNKVHEFISRHFGCCEIIYYFKNAHGFITKKMSSKATDVLYDKIVNIYVSNIYIMCIYLYLYVYICRVYNRYMNKAVFIKRLFLVFP